jgi:hypothetical protein
MPIAIVEVLGASATIDADVANATEIWERECGVFIDVVARVQVNRPQLLILAQNDCTGAGHVVSAEEDALFAIGRTLGTAVVGYYISGDVAGFAGCAAHPPGRRGFWVGDAASPWTFGHELTHVVGRNAHVGDSDNLMSTPTASITNPPPDLEPDQTSRILNDAALLCVSSIVLNL